MEPSDYETVKPQNIAYGRYADAQIEELIDRYHPSVLWNDIDWPKSGQPLKIMADYYNAVLDGVVDDRYPRRMATCINPAAALSLGHRNPTQRRGIATVSPT
jgi:alpha-L-fucosidase